MNDTRDIGATNLCIVQHPSTKTSDWIIFARGNLGRQHHNLPNCHDLHPLFSPELSLFVLGFSLPADDIKRLDNFPDLVRHRGKFEPMTRRYP